MELADAGIDELWDGAELMGEETEADDTTELRTEEAGADKTTELAVDETTSSSV